jgi:hypothetical protein
VTAALVSGASSSTVNLSGSGAGYNASLGALNIAAQGNAGWSITGASPTISVALNGSSTYSVTGALTAETLTVSDSADNASVTLSYNGTSQTLTGSVVQTSTGATAATFSVLASTGSGTVTYGNGTTAQIVNWIVQS